MLVDAALTCSILQTIQGSARSRPKHIVYEPFALLLANHGVPEDPRRDEHLVGRLQYALKVRRIALR